MIILFCLFSCSHLFFFLFLRNGNCLTVKKNDNNCINKGHWLPGITIRAKYQGARWQVNFFFWDFNFFLWKCVSVLWYLPKDQFLFIYQRLDLKTSPLLLTLSWCHNTFWKERELKANTVILILSHMQGRYSESYTWCNPLFWPATKPHFNISYCTCHFWIG